MSQEVLLVLCNCPDDATADRLADELVTTGLAACVNIGPTVTSVYQWQGTIERAQERTLFIKTTQATYSRVEASLRAGHPYELPEIVAIPITQGLPGYLEWVRKCTTNN